MSMLRPLCALAICLAIVREASAFSPSRSERRIPIPRSAALDLQSPHAHGHGSDRRTFLVQQIAAPAIASVAIALPTPATAAAPLLMDKSSPDIPPFSGGAPEAKKRFQLAIKDIDDLLSNYEVISKSGGDNVRLYLGTQGVKSHMYGVTKVLKSLKEEADDIVEYTETLNEFEAYLFQAEGAAYQSMFAEHSSAKSTPESLLRTARGDIVSMRKFMGDLARQLSLDA